MVNNSHRSGSYAGKLSKSQVSARFIIILPLVLIGMACIVHASPFTGGEIAGQYTAAINMTAVTDMFFYDGDMIPIIANYTNLSDGLGYDGLTVTGNFSLVGGSGNVSATGLGGKSGVYKLNSTVNFSSITVNNIQPFNISVSGYNGTDYINTTVTALLVNMSTLPGCPPPDVQLPPEAPLSNWTMVGPIAGCNSSCAPNEGPAKWNGTHYIICGPNFAGSTTNFSDIAKNGNFSSVPLVLDIPGKAKINFTTPVDMGTNEKMQSIFEFAIKLLSSGGKIGFNSSEYSGIDPNKPNLNLSAEITIYNVTGLLGISNKPSIGYQQIYTPNGSAPSIVCPPSICSPENIIWDGENITFTITHFSTYVVGSANYTLTFNNLSSTTLYVGPDANASYVLNVTNYGNTTETYNMSVNGSGILNVTQITLNPDESTTILLNVSNSSDGTYYSNVTGILSTNSSIIMNSFEDIGHIVTIVDNTAPNQPQLNSPQSGAINQNLTVTLNITLTDPDEDPMNVTFYNNGTGQQIANATNIANGSSANVTWSGLNHSTTYYWYANATDGEYTTKSNVWNFTTKDAPDNPPNITLNLPQANYYNDTSDPVNVTFNCSATDDNNLVNISLYITNSTNHSFALNQTSNITGVSNSSTWTLELSSGNYTWNCLAYDNASQSGWGDSNRTLSINASGAGQNDSYEPDNNYTSANWIETDGTPQTHTFAPAGDADWIKFNATESAEYIIQTSALGDGADTNITLYEQDGETNITENDDIEPGIIRRSKIIWTAAGTGTYFVKAGDWNVSHANGSYNISITELPDITLSILGNSNRDVQKGELFNITLNINCSGINCTNLEIYLDPEKQKPKRPQQLPPKSANLLDRLDSLPEGEYDVIIILKDITAKELSKSGSKLNRHVGVRSTRHPKLEARKQAVTTRQNAVLSGLDAPRMRTRTMRTMNTVRDEFTLKRKYDVINALSGRITKQGLKALKNNPNVKSVQLSRKLTISLDTSVPQINADDAWATQYNGINITGKGQTICVLDTGINYNHSDFGGANGFPSAKVIEGYDFVNDDNDPWDDHSHGSHCAGIAASQDTTYRGVAPDAKIVAMKVMDSSGEGYDSDIIAGIDWCVYHAEELNISVISMSLGDDNISTTYCDSNPMAIAVNYANDYGIMIAVAAGNDNGPGGVTHPACASGATTVSSIQKDDSTFNYNRGPLTNVVAPGFSIQATDYANPTGHVHYSGTSMATPHVAGAAALLNQYYKLHDGLNLHAEQIEIALEDSGAIKHDSGSGLNFSRVDVQAALSEPIPKGIISTQSNATPFYTLNSNPNITSLDAGTSKQITWTINATGSYGTYDFFAFTNLDDGEDEITSNNVNITIVDNTYPQLNIESPVADAILDTSTVDFIFNVTDELDDTLSCSLYLNGQLNQTNTSVIEGTSTNFTKTLSDGNYSWHINCTDAYDNHNTTSPANLTIDATPPAVWIILPENRTYTGTAMNLNYSLSDENPGSVWYEYNDTNTTITANTTFTALDNQQSTLTLYANDSAGNTNSTGTTFTVDTTYPAFSDYKRIPNTPNEEENVQVNVTLSETPDTVILEWNGTTNYTVTTNSGHEYYFTIINGTNYTAHDTITYYWYANDTAGNQNKSDEQSFAIANQLPTVSAPSLNDTTPKTNNTINCTGGTFGDNDEEDTEQDRTYRWYDNTTLISGQTSQVLDLSVPGLDKGDNITCSVRVYDNYDWSNWVNSTNNATILNSAPTHTAPILNSSSGTNRTDEDLTCYNQSTSDIDDDAITNKIRWFKNTIAVPALENQTTIASGNTTKAEAWLCEVTPYDNENYGTPLNSSPLTILNTQPAATNIILNSTDNLNRTNGTLQGFYTFNDADLDPETGKETKWYNNSAEVISLRNTTTVGSGNTTKGEMWIFSVRVYDSEHWSNWVNSTGITIQNAAPTTTTPTLDPTTIYKTTAQVTCSNASVSDADADSITWYYQWYVNNVKNITTQAISNSSYSKGDELICEIWASDTESNSTKYNSSNATVLNLAPSQPTLNSPQSGATNQDLTLTLNVTVTDPDTDTMNVTFWNNATGQQIGNTTNIPNGNHANITWSNLNYSTTYSWYANTTDGQYTIKSSVWNFTTKSPSFLVTLNSPDTQTATNDNTPDFNFTVSGTGNSYNCSLYMNGTSTGNNETVSNNVHTVITSSTLSDSNYGWHINCTLAGVANSSETRTLTVDATSPVITILSPGAQSNYSTLSISFNTTLNEPGSWCGYSLDGAPNTTMNYTTGKWWNINETMTEAQHTVRFFCNDTAGNMANTTERTFTIDTTPPIFNTPTPANNSGTNTGITLNATDTGTGIASVKYSVNDSANVTSSTIPITSLAEGANTIHVYAEDFAGNTNQTQYAYTKDTIAPVLTINLPTNSTETTTNSTELNYSLDELANATWYTIDNIRQTLNNSALRDNLTINFTDTAGRHTLYVYANDSVGNLRQKTIHIRYNTVFNMSNYTQSLEDTTGANITITANTSGDITTNATALLNETLNMTLNTTDIIVSLENFYGLSAAWSESFTMNTTNSTVSDEIIEIGTNVSKMIHFSGLDGFLENTQYNGTATFSPYNSSAYTDIIYCTGDNSESCTRIGACINNIFNGTACYIDKLTNITVYVPHFSSVILGNDTIAPQIAIDTPANTETNGFDININLTVTEDTTACNYSLNHSALINITMTKTDATHFTKTISAFLPNSDYALNVTCKDANNNYNTTSKTFTVLDNIKPIMSAPSASKTTTSATITWTTDEKTDARINYSTTTSLGTQKNATENATTHSIAISGLSSSTTYYYNITSCDLEDNCNTTGPHSFTTSASGDIGGGTPGRGPTSGGAIIPPQAEEEEPEQQAEPKKEEEEPKEEQATPEEDTRQKQEAQELISGAEHKIQSLKDKHDLKAAIEKLDEAKKAFDSKDYAKAKQLAKEALKLINQAKPITEQQEVIQCPIIPHKILNICLIYIITTLIVLTLATLLIISNRKKLSQRAPKTESPLPIHNTETIKPHTNEPEHHHHLDINEEISRLLKSLSETKPLLNSKDTVLAMDANNKIDQISLEIDQAKELMRSGNKHEAARHIKRGNRLLESIKEELSDSA